LDLSEWKQQVDGENFIIWSFIIYYSPYIIRVVKSRTIRWTEHVASIGVTV